ncbi:DUF6188 family protein [Cellulomonas sp. P5_E12]
MDLAFDGFVVTEVAIDFTLRLNGLPRGTFTFENAVLIERPDHGSDLIPVGTRDLTGVAAFDFLSGLTVGAAVAESTGSLAVTFTDGSRLRVDPSRDFEAWGAVSPEGVQYICLPGGEIATFGLPGPS